MYNCKLLVVIEQHFASRIKYNNLIRGNTFVIFGEIKDLANLAINRMVIYT